MVAATIPRTGRRKTTSISARKEFRGTQQGFGRS
jgi:hypothetical protein